MTVKLLAVYALLPGAAGASRHGKGKGARLTIFRIRAGSEWRSADIGLRANAGKVSGSLDVHLKQAYAWPDVRAGVAGLRRNFLPMTSCRHDTAGDET